ncbi:MAG: RidA family protein [Xanthomonadales bacterium]|nr:RidA family protein [Xanthomonadales bacterium]
MKKHLSTGSTFEQEFAYSRAVIDGNYVFVSGTTGYNYDTMTISDNVVEQAEQCFINIQKALVWAGSDINQVLRIRYILPNKQDFSRCAPVLQKYLSEARPAATMLEAGLLDGAMKIEIEVTAKKN